MPVHHLVVRPAADFLSVLVSKLAYCRSVGMQAVSGDYVYRSVVLQRFLHEAQSRLLVPFLGDVTLKYFSPLVDRSPEVVGYPIDLHKHLIEVPALLSEAKHTVDALALDVRCKHRPELVPPEPHGLIADIKLALKQQVLDVPQAQRKADGHHHHQPNDLW